MLGIEDRLNLHGAGYFRVTTSFLFCIDLFNDIDPRLFIYH